MKLESRFERRRGIGSAKRVGSGREGSERCVFGGERQCMDSVC